MKGYIFEYYKYFRCTAESLEFFRQNETPVLNYEGAEKSILTFGDFDRLKVNIIKDFTRYRDFSELGKTWFGNRQSLLLYELDEENRFSYKESEHGDEFLINDEPDEHLFWALTEFPFRNSERERCNSYTELLADTKRMIHEMIPQNNEKNVNYEVFGTLGTLGIVVLWMGDQFTDILNLVNQIKNKSNNKFLSARTIFSKNPKYNNAKRDDEKLKQLKGNALVQITLKKSLTDQETFLFPENIQVKNTVHTPGAYDISLMISAKDALYLFENCNYLNHDKDEYQRRFLQTRVTLCKDLKFQTIDETDIPDSSLEQSDIKKLLKNLEQVKIVYEAIRKLMEEKVVKTAGLIDTLDSLICDYRSNIVSAVNESWAEDFSYVFQKNLECMKELLIMSCNTDLSKNPKNILDVLRIIMNNLKQQIFHIAESNNLDLEDPKCHLRYTGQEDGLLFCYMGMIKEILQTAYQLKGYNKQSEIVPVVTVDVVPIIESELYFDKKTYMDETEPDQEFKILGLNLPHVSFFEIPVYFQFLYHEIYHYVVPEDREKRDYIIGIILVINYLSDLLEKCVRNITHSEEVSTSIIYRILALVSESVCCSYMTLHKSITTVDGIGVYRNERDTVLFIEDNYVEKVFEFIKGMEGTGFIEECLKQIGQRLAEPKAKGLVTFEDFKELVPDNSQYEKLVKFFSCREENQLIKEIIQAENQEIFLYLQKYLDGLKEVAADIPMIELTDMPLSEYLLFYVNCMKTSMVSPESLNSEGELKEQLRIGVILEQYCLKDQSLESAKNEFIFKFIAKYFYCNFPAAAGNEFQEKLCQLYIEAEKWITFFEKCAKRQKRDFVFEPLQKKYCELYSVSSRVKEMGEKTKIEENSKNYFSGYRAAMKNFAETMEDIYNHAAERNPNESKKLYEEGKHCYNKAMFRENVKLFQHFQKQTSLEELHQINANENNQKRDNSSTPDIEVSFDVPKNIVVKSSGTDKIKTSQISNFEELVGEIQVIISLLKNSIKIHLGKSDLKIWYRGQENAEYGLIPNIVRKTTGNKRRFNYLAQYQRCLFGEFKFRCDGAVEMQDRSHYDISDYLALMQHFGAYTNLMDWSENAFAALYFALEKVLIGETADAKTDAALWIFSPQLYNEARKYMIMNEAAKEACTEAAFRASLKTIEGYDGMIPNISVKQNESIYDMFLLGNIEYESPNKYGYKEEKKLSGHEEMAYLPIAAYTSRLNPRIKAQGGIFVAFNLYAEPSKTTEYDYMALDKIQEYYFQHCSRAHKEQFLYKITINKNAVKDIAGCIKSMGINKEFVYPELENVGKRVK